MPIRLRLALLFTLAMMLLLAGGGYAYWRQLGAGLNASLDTSLRSRATALQAEVLENDTADIHETGPGALLGFGDTIAQVVTSSGRVLESSNGLPKASLMTIQQLATAGRGHLTFDTTITSAPSVGAQPQDYHVRLFAAPSGSPGVLVIVGANRDVVDDALHRATHQLLFFGILVLLLGISGSYLLARAALRPVDVMRAQAAELNAHDAGAGLKVPATRDEVSRLAVTMNALLGRLHEALARERAFVADAGHELRTPLTVLKGELELAGRPGRSAEQLSRTVTIAAAETDRLIRLSEDLLLLAQADEGSILAPKTTDVLALATAATDGQYRAAARVGVTVLPPVGDQAIAVVDQDRMRQAIDNLLSNAIRYAPAGTSVQTSIEFTFVADREAVAISVTDHGPGFPPNFLPVAFERFRRADTARTRESPSSGGSGRKTMTGSGLGLAIVHTIAVSHAGSVEAVNNQDGGATVTITVPTKQR